MASNIPRLLVVCGMPRSGTRNFVNALNAHPAVNLTGEIPRSVMVRLFELAEKVESTYRKNERYSRNWKRKRELFLFESMFSVSKSGRRRLRLDGSEQFVGTKTPNHEFLFQQYESYFAQSVSKPMYVFCARNPEACWRSYRSMPWATLELRKFARRYVRSYAQLTEMQKVAPGRCIVANLDKLVAQSDQATYLADNLLAPLGLKVEEETLRKLRGLRNSNSTIEKTGRQPIELPGSEIAYISRHRELAGIREAHF